MIEKRMIGDSGYEVTQAFRIGSKEILLAQNLNADSDNIYLVCDLIQNALIAQYQNGIADGNYLEVVREFTQRIDDETTALQAERDNNKLPVDLFTAEHCIPHSYGQCIIGMVVALKPEVLAPEYRCGSEQLIFVTGGFGADVNSRGNAVFCYQLSDRKQVRFELYQVLGIIKPESIPDWAKDRLREIKQTIAEERKESHKDRSDAR